MTIRRELHRERAGDLHHLLLGDGEVAHQRHRIARRARCAAVIARVSAAMRRQLTKKLRARLAADEDVLGDRHVRGERELLVDRDDAELLRVVRAGERNRPRRRSRSCRHPAARAPDRILRSVDLPAPFSPSSAWISPGADLEIDVVERLHAGKALADPGHAQERLGHALSSQVSARSPLPLVGRGSGSRGVNVEWRRTSPTAEPLPTRGRGVA